uniref:TLDc domain-containing protein n=1 Tax=Attheya septentrionalis TaxID=420275 RepID=A0A7S2U8P1_9STRA|mmetsp:Transcript_13482/g.24410  ORF Transcript_13482/g.24410 Transcript_13482/m.24410 type:complete len:303 (+) Transcript_13482:98-1006(+)
MDRSNLRRTRPMIASSRRHDDVLLQSSLSKRAIVWFLLCLSCGGMTRNTCFGFVVLDRPTLAQLAPIIKARGSDHSPLSLGVLGMVSPSLGDLFSGVTGRAPESLEPPAILLEGTNLENVPLERVYKASRDGWSASTFHDMCDGRGSAVVVALGANGKRFGGYNPVGWRSTDDYSSSNAAFLFALTSSDGTKSSIIKCPVLSGGNAAIYDYATGGPTFGAADLVIGPPRAAVMGGFTGPDTEDTTINAGSLKEGRSSVGGAYEFQKGWPVAGRFTMVEVEVYCNANMTPESQSSQSFSFWPF